MDRLGGKIVSVEFTFQLCRRVECEVVVVASLFRHESLELLFESIDCSIRPIDDEYIKCYYIVVDPRYNAMLAAAVIQYDRGSSFCQLQLPPTPLKMMVAFIPLSLLTSVHCTNSFSFFNNGSNYRTN